MNLWSCLANAWLPSSGKALIVKVRAVRKPRPHCERGQQLQTDPSWRRKRVKFPAAFPRLRTSGTSQFWRDCSRVAEEDGLVPDGQVPGDRAEDRPVAVGGRLQSPQTRGSVAGTSPGKYPPLS